MADFSSVFEDDDDTPVTVTLPSVDGEGVDEYQVIPPTAEQLVLFASSFTDAAKAPAALMELLEDLFEPDDFAKIRTRMRAKRGDPARLRMGQLAQVIESVMEGKADFPTQPSSASSSSDKPTGRRSTGRVHSQALTPAGSPSDGS